MENLSESQYEGVLNLMEKHPELEYQQASQFMQKANYDLNKGSLLYNSGATFQQHPNSYEVPLRGLQGDDEEIIEEEQLDKMKKYLLKRMQNDNKPKRLMKKSKQCLTQCMFQCIQKLLPELIKRKIIKSEFYQLYQDTAVIQLKNRNLDDAEMKARENKKYLMIIVSAKQECNYHIKCLLTNKKLLKTIESMFQIVGILEDEARNSDTLQIQSPNCIILARHNRFQELQPIRTFESKQIQEIEPKKIQEIVQIMNEKQKQQIKKMRRATEKLYSANLIAMNSSAYEVDEDEDEDEAEDQAQNYLKNVRESALIRKQNEQYEKMLLSQTQEKQYQKEKTNQLTMIKQQRDARRISIPEQPVQEGQGIIKIYFRCPNGQTVLRKFQKTQHCSILFNWVDLNEDIEFEDEGFGEQGMRKFDLLFSYPPQSLNNHLQTQIGSVFEEETVKIMIKEL